MTSVVYFIRAAGRIKIGYTKNLKSRFSAINTSSPEPAELLATVPGGKDLESILHAKLKPQRHKHEWFNDCAEVHDLMAELLAGNPDAFVPTPKQPEPEEPSVISAADELSKSDDVTDRLLGDVQRRFSALLNHPLIDEVYEARAMERKLAMARGEIVSSMVGGHEPVLQCNAAFDLLYRNFKKFTKVTDRLFLAVFDEGVPEAPLRRAAEILIDRTEAAFAALEIKKPELQMPFLAGGASR